MKLQNLTVIFIIIIIPVILLVSLYISTGLKTIKYQSLYDTGLLTATHDAIYAFELNTTNDAYSDNAETKRNILKSSVKMFEKSLANTCGISAYNADEIEEYIPAIVFGMYDGFYMYAPSYNSQTGKYEHDLKNYVYYSETLDDGTVITYSLDNYVTVSGKLKNEAGKEEYMIKEGYLIDLTDSTADGKKYKGIAIDTDDTDAINYYKDAYKFTKWFKDNVEDKADYLRINSDNDPEDETSNFVQNKREIMKKKIESVLNSSITAYSERTWNRTYKMPKLSEEDWQKIYSNISMITFFQGKNIGLTKYNGYCVLNSTNSNEYVNPNLMYFIDGNDDTDHYYHDIRCSKISTPTQLTGYKIGDFQKIKLSKALNTDGTPKTDGGKQLYDNDGTTTTNPYKYNHNALACYNCVNGSLATSTSVYNYVKPNGGIASTDIKTSYWTSLARERHNTVKILNTNDVNYFIDTITANTQGVEIIPATGHTIEDVKNGDLIEGDIIKFGDYEYHYNQYFDNWSKTWKSTQDYDIWTDGWNAKVRDRNKETYEKPVTYIYGSKLKGMMGTFYNCTKLIQTVEVPDTVEDMLIAYEGCDSLKKVTSIGKNVKNLRGAFWSCDNLQIVECAIPESVTNMVDTFTGCINLEGNIEVNSINIENCGQCFKNTQKEIILTGNSTQKQKLVETANRNNVKIKE